MDSLNEIIVAPVTRTIRGLRTEVLLTEEDGAIFYTTAILKSLSPPHHAGRTSPREPTPPPGRKKQITSRWPALFL